jgi:hypothetical protein
MKKQKEQVMNCLSKYVIGLNFILSFFIPLTVIEPAACRSYEKKKSTLYVTRG